jgi:hypothetical protein
VQTSREIFQEKSHVFQRPVLLGLCCEAFHKRCICNLIIRERGGEGRGGEGREGGERGRGREGGGEREEGEGEMGVPPRYLRSL